jgi:DNA-binding MarR family transcriptional regulator
MSTVPTAAGRKAWGVLTDILSTGEANERAIEASSRVGLTPALFKALRYLPQRAGVSMRELAAQWRCDASYVTGVVDNLEARGFARRRAHPTDRRVKIVVATRAGVRARNQVAALLAEPPPAMDSLTTREQRQLLALLQKVDAANRQAATAGDDDVNRSA